MDGSLCSDPTPLTSYEMRTSLYEPPYLFKPTLSHGDGSSQCHLRAADQPRSDWHRGQCLVRPDSATDGTETNARRVDLPISGTGATRTATVPANAVLLPPGPYMLMVLDDKGAVSTASRANVR